VYADVYRREFKNTIPACVTWIEETFSQVYLPIFLLCCGSYVPPMDARYALPIVHAFSTRGDAKSALQHGNIDPSPEYLLSRDTHGAQGGLF
jgi:hypothetical protein